MLEGEEVSLRPIQWKFNRKQCNFGAHNLIQIGTVDFANAFRTMILSDR